MDFSRVFKNGFIKKVLSQFITDNTVIDKIIQIFYNILGDFFSFDDGFNKVKLYVGSDNTENIDDFIFYNYIASILYYMSIELKYDFILPGSITDWKTNYLDNTMTFFLYDLDADPNEITNILDPNYSGSTCSHVNSILNNLLNQRIKETGMDPTIFIIPDKSIALMCYNFYIIGGKIISNYTSSDIIDNLFLFLNGTNSLDTKLSSKKIKEINITVNNILTNLGTNSIPDDPYTIYDKCCDNKNIFVGQNLYMKKVFKTGYIANMFTEPVIKKGIFTDTKFVNTDLIYTSMSLFIRNNF